MLELGLYMLMWSPLYVHQPSASSETSPVPITKPLFMRMLVRMRAWTFSKMRSCRFSRGTCCKRAVSSSRPRPSQVDAEGPMAEGLHLLQAEPANVHFARRHAQVLHQGPGVAARPRTGAEAGHREGADAATRHAQGVRGLAGHEQGERGVEAARNADADGRLADMFQTFRKAGHLRVKISSQRSRSCSSPPRHEGMCLDFPGQPLRWSGAFQIETDPCEVQAEARQ